MTWTSRWKSSGLIPCVRLVLVASPHVLGLLRRRLHSEVLNKVVAEVDKTLTNLEATSENALVVSADAKAMTADIRAGKGTIGGLMSDQEIYDDLKEMLRELKRRPWKIMWKE